VLIGKKADSKGREHFQRPLRKTRAQVTLAVTLLSLTSLAPPVRPVSASYAPPVDLKPSGMEPVVGSCLAETCGLKVSDSYGLSVAIVIFLLTPN
jgi:hypothetical protein